MKVKGFAAIVVAGATASFAAAASPAPLKFRAQTIDPEIKIGYGLAIADVDGDGHADILLADAKQIAWYRAPQWEKFVMAENLTPQDHVCIAAADLDGDGRAEVAVGAGWNPGDTVNSGAVFLLEAPADRTQRWTPRALPHEPTVHRMAWMRTRDGHRPFLAVLPLHGRGNQNATGEGVRFLGYPWPWTERSQPFALADASQPLHAAHNFEVRANGTDAIVAAKEGIFAVAATSSPSAAAPLFPGAGAGEVRLGRTTAGEFFAAIEPMHGHRLVVFQKYSASAPPGRLVLDENLVQGHALATGDLLGISSDQIVVGWRGNGRPGDRVGIKVYAPADPASAAWELHTVVDDGGMACEDLKLADLNGDGRLDIIAAGRTTRNVIIYWNEGVQPASKPPAG